MRIVTGQFTPCRRGDWEDREVVDDPPWEESPWVVEAGGVWIRALTVSFPSC